MLDARSICITTGLWECRRALYQLHLVRASDARKFIPSELPLVELFGHAHSGQLQDILKLERLLLTNTQAHPGTRWGACSWHATLTALSGRLTRCVPGLPSAAGLQDLHGLTLACRA